MQALRLDINDYRPVLTDSSLKAVYRSIMTDIAALRTGDGYRNIRRECLNGIAIDVEISAEGNSYRDLQLDHVYVMYKQSGDDEYTPIEEYEDTLANMFSESIRTLNEDEEKHYYQQQTYSR